MLTKEQLLAKRDEILAYQRKIENELSAVAGAIQCLNELLELCDQPCKKPDEDVSE